MFSKFFTSLRVLPIMTFSQNENEMNTKFSIFDYSLVGNNQNNQANHQGRRFGTDLTNIQKNSTTGLENTKHNPPISNPLKEKDTSIESASFKSSPSKEDQELGEVDKEKLEDPQYVAEYAKEIFENLRSEVKFPVL